MAIRSTKAGGKRSGKAAGVARELDRSGRRLWCDMNVCGNRAKGRRHQKLKRKRSGNGG